MWRLIQNEYHTNAQQTHEMMLNIAHYSRNTNQNYSEVHLTMVRMAIIKNLQAINAGEGVEKMEPSYTVRGNAN